MIFTFLVLIFMCFSAQNIAGISLEIRQESKGVKGNMRDFILVVKNESSIHFKGTIEVRTPSGFRSVSGNNIAVDANGGSCLYVPVKILVNHQAACGEALIQFLLTDTNHTTMAKEQVIDHVSENNNVRITAENPVVYVSRTNDSIEVKTRVSNLGNKKQHVLLVFKVPEFTEETVFIEKRGVIGIGKDSIFTFRLMPSKALMRNTQFTVHIAGFREPDKEIIGNTSVSIQNVSSTQHYQEVSSNAMFSDFTKNNITTSYRHIGDRLNMYQLLGSGGFNLPSGYIFMRGNIYLLNYQKDPIVSNTYISYHMKNHEFTVGNINKILELPLLGRGVDYGFISSDQKKKIEMGFVDQSFSLIEKNSLLKYGYGFYVKGLLEAQNTSRNISGTYIFRKDPYDQTKHHILGSDFRYSLGGDWKIDSKVYSGLSSYESIHKIQPSLALESQYSGIINTIRLNGNYFYSTRYYPGNRRGMIQIQQNFSTRLLNDYDIYARIMIANFSPKFYFYDNALKSNNIRWDMGIDFPKKGNFGLGMGYQYQAESANTYTHFFGFPGDEKLKQLAAHRLTEILTWLSPNKKHSSILGVETGLVKYPDINQSQFQMKISGNYHYQWLNVSCTYQYGSYFLSEYAFSRILTKGNAYKKLSLAAFVNKNFFNEKVNLASGLSYSDDVLYGKSPSGFINLKYSGERYGLYLNSSWFNYSSAHLNNSLLTIEFGVTVNLQAHTLNSGKKSEINAFVYYDYNHNNIYDEGDQQAAGYLMKLNNIFFKTNEKGNIVYTAAPFGKYVLKQVVQRGWYYDELELDVNRHHFLLEIPLHQNGTSRGKVMYEFDAKKVLEFRPKISGIQFDVFKNGQFLQQIMTDDNGEFVSFLESGNYTIKLNETSLPENTYVKKLSSNFIIEAGKIINIDPFIIKVHEKTIRVKKFGN